MPSVHGDRFGSDLYEGKSVLFLYDGRKCPQNKLSAGWILVPFLIVTGIPPLIVVPAEAIAGNAPWFLPPLAVLGYLAFLAVLSPIVLWRHYGRQTLRIDARHVRCDWWYFCVHGTKIFERNGEIAVGTVRCEEYVGTKALQLTFGKTKRIIPLSTAAEADWLRDRIGQFLQRVPPETVAAEPPKQVRTVKGKFTDPDSGPAILQSLSWDGEPLSRVIPDIERNGGQPPKSRDAVQVRCCRCHAFVPPDRVWPNRAAAQCVECGAVFSVPELVRIPPPKQRRVTLQRDGETLVIRQGGNFGVMPVLTLLTLIAGIGGIAALLLYAHSLNPDASFYDILSTPPPNHHPNASRGTRGISVLFMTVMLIPFALLPVWAFIERRVIRIDRRECRMTIRWLFFRWERVVSRHDLLFASKRPWGLGEVFALHYRDAGGKTRTFLIGSNDGAPGRSATTPNWLTGEVNHELMTVPPEVPAPTSQPPVAFGGIHLAGDEPYLVCLRCGEHFATQSLVLAKGKNREMPQIDGLECRETPGGFEIHYTPVVSKAIRRTNVTVMMICACLFLILFGGLPIVMLIRACHEGQDIGTWIFLTVMGGAFSLFFVLMGMMEMRETGDWEWRLDFHSGKLELWFRYKKRERRIVIPAREITRVDENSWAEPVVMVKLLFREWRTGELQLPTLQCRKHLALRDGTRQYFPGVMTAGNHQKGSDFDEWLTTRIELHLAKHPRETR